MKLVREGAAILMPTYQVDVSIFWRKKLANEGTTTGMADSEFDTVISVTFLDLGCDLIFLRKKLARLGAGATTGAVKLPWIEMVLSSFASESR